MLALMYMVLSSADPTTGVTLTGTTGSPNEASDSQISPTNASAGWRFNNDGTIDIHEGVGTYTFSANWHDSPSQDYWIRTTLNNGTVNNSGISTGSWLKLYGTGSADRETTWLRTTTGFYTNDSLKVEIATDASGVDIVATGYYGISIVEKSL